MSATARYTAVANEFTPPAATTYRELTKTGSSRQPPGLMLSSSMSTAAAAAVPR